MEQKGGENEQTGQRHSTEKNEDTWRLRASSNGSTNASLTGKDLAQEKAPIDLENPEEPEGQLTLEVISDPNLVDWDGPDDPANPLNWSSGIRMAHIAFASLSCLMVYEGSILPIRAFADSYIEILPQRCTHQPQSSS